MKKNLSELLKIQYPVIQGGMANIATAALAAAVSNAGGLGLIGAGGNDKAWVKREIDKMRELTDKPFGVNVMLLSPHAKDIAQLVVDENIKVVTTGAGSPAPYMDMWKEKGIIVIPVVASVYHALRVERIGADAVVVEGSEAGGHIGETTSMVLIPQVSDACQIPVIAAGGIGDARSVMAAFVLGAQGVQIGSILLATKECPIHENYKELVVASNDTATTVTGRNTGHPVRLLKNELTHRYFELIKQQASEEELNALTTGSLAKAVFEGDVQKGSFMAGQVVGMVKEVKTVQEVIQDLFKPIELPVITR